MSAETIAAVLGGQQAGTSWITRYPTHDAREPSLAVHDADGKVLVFFHAGCGQRAVAWPEDAIERWIAQRPHADPAEPRPSGRSAT